jgi:hypothetical protein
MMTGHWPHAHVLAARPRAGGPSTIAVIERVRHPVRLIQVGDPSLSSLRVVLDVKLLL